MFNINKNRQKLKNRCFLPYYLIHEKNLKIREIIFLPILMILNIYIGQNFTL